MGYEVQSIAFYEISTNKTFPVALPTSEQLDQFVSFLNRYHSYNPEQIITINRNKCKHCIYCNLCDKASEENVYQ